MKQICKKILFTLIIIISVNCKSKNSSNEIQSNQNQIKRVWMLVQFQDFEKEYLISKGAMLDLTNFKRAISKMGCNNLSFQYILKKNAQINFKSEVSTRMACPEMKLEREFSHTITTIISYKIEAHKLTLIDKEGNKMTFIAQDWD